MNYLSTHKLKSFLILVFCFFVYIALSQSQEKQVVFVPYTGDTDSFVSKLAAEGLIQNKFSEMILRVVLAIKGDIQPGGYEFSRGMGAVSTALAIDEPQYEYILIFDGFRKGQIGEIIGDKLGWSEEKIKEFGETEQMCGVKGDEGFLASGTYLIHKREDIEVVQETMQKTFDDILADLGIDEKDVNVPEIITIASLIQREAAGKADMRLISGVIQNRLEKGMALQIDATLQYAKGHEGNWWPIPRPEDKWIDSVFNTYKYEGLPPAPIATPSKEAIRAALNPIKTDCLFYLHDSRRNIHCATTYEKHKRNIDYYLR